MVYQGYLSVHVTEFAVRQDRMPSNVISAYDPPPAGASSLALTGSISTIAL